MSREIFEVAATYRGAERSICAAAVSDRARAVASCPAAIRPEMMYGPEWPVPPVMKTRMLLAFLSGVTWKFIDARRLALLGKNGYLINIALGSVVDQSALIHALETGVIAGAGLAVLDLRGEQHSLPDWPGKHLLRLCEDAGIDRMIGLPVPRPVVLTFGGRGRDVLYITSARHDVPLDALTNAPACGNMFCIPTRDGPVCSMHSLGSHSRGMRNGL